MGEEARTENRLGWREQLAPLHEERSVFNPKEEGDVCANTFFDSLRHACDIK